MVSLRGYDSGMNLRANSTFRAGDWSRLEGLLVPKLTVGAQNAANAVLEISQGIVPVASGDLQRSGGTAVEWKGTTVTGFVTYGAYYAAYVEFGTGRRGAGSAGAGPFPYNQNWPGMVAQPYIRPALDQGRGQVMDAFREALAV